MCLLLGLVGTYHACVVSLDECISIIVFIFAFPPVPMYFAGNDHAVEQGGVAGEAQRAARVAKTLVLRRSAHILILFRGGAAYRWRSSRWQPWRRRWSRSFGILSQHDALDVGCSCGSRVGRCGESRRAQCRRARWTWRWRHW